MPCYEYECPKCGAKTEYNVSAEQHAKLGRPVCDEPCNTKMKRVYFPTPAVYKSEGFTKQTKEDK